MNNDPQTTEIKNLVEQTHEIVIQIAKDQNQMRGEITQISERIGSLEGRMTALETRMSNLESRMSKEIRDVFKWLIGMMILVWIGVIGTLIIQFLRRVNNGENV